MNWRDPALAVLRVWWWLARPRTVGVRGIVTDDQGRILLVRHSYGGRRWFLPGGGGGFNESADESLVREMREETGLEVEITGLSGVYLDLTFYKQDNVFVFTCRCTGGALCADGAEIAETGWYALDALPEPLFPGTRQVLADWQAGRTGFGRWGDRDA